MSLKKSIVFLLVAACAIGFIFLATSAFAQDTPAAAPIADTAIPAPAPTPEVAPEAEMTWEEFSDQLGKLFSDWRTLGFFGVIIIIVNLLILLLRFRPLNEWLGRKGWKWIKVYIAAGLGGLLAVLTSIQTGAGVLQSIGIGIAAGFAAVGAYQAKTARKAEKKKKENGG